MGNPLACQPHPIKGLLPLQTPLPLVIYLALEDPDKDSHPSTSRIPFGVFLHSVHFCCWLREKTPSSFYRTLPHPQEGLAPSTLAAFLGLTKISLSPRKSICHSSLLSFRPSSHPSSYPSSHPSSYPFLTAKFPPKSITRPLPLLPHLPQSPNHQQSGSHTEK